MTTNVVVTGATGKTGNAVAHGLAEHGAVDLVACVAPSVASTPTRDLPSGLHCSSVDELDVDVDVLVDFTHAEPAVGHIEWALGNGVHCVLGTTGLADAVLADYGKQFEAAGLGMLYAPNFAIGAVMMMRFAEQAAQVFDSAEVVEMHGAAKRDAPSGTARRTAQLIAQAGVVPARRDGAPALGELVDGIPVHSLRIAGAVAHQEVVFGAAGQYLTIRHDAVDRACYVPGVVLAIEHVVDRPGLTIGLEQLL